MLGASMNSGKPAVGLREVGHRPFGEARRLGQHLKLETVIATISSALEPSWNHPLHVAR